MSSSSPFQFRLVHLMLMMAAVAVWLGAYRLRDPVLMFVVLVPTLALGPLLIWRGNRTGRVDVAFAGVMMTYSLPVLAIVLIGINSLVQYLK